MLKYTDIAISFEEVPDEINLCINISNCPCRCEGCHSKYLWDNIGIELTKEELSKIIEKNKGVTCICFMGGDREPNSINLLAKYIKHTYNNLKFAWYSGREYNNNINLKYFDYLKFGPYIKKYGPINKETTNQRMYKIQNSKLNDITSRFWKSEVLGDN